MFSGQGSSMRGPTMNSTTTAAAARGNPASRRSAGQLTTSSQSLVHPSGDLAGVSLAAARD